MRWSFLKAVARGPSKLKDITAGGAPMQWAVRHVNCCQSSCPTKVLDSRSLTKGGTKLGFDGVIAGQVVSRAKVLVEAAGEVNRWAGQVTAGLASKERVSLQYQI